MNRSYKKEEVPAPDCKGYAVMDLGTNVFHLLIIDAGHKEIVRENIDVKLGEGGINKGLIQPAAFDRGVAAMKRFSEQILSCNTGQVKAIATSALRNAANGPDFISAVKKATGIVIEIIDGDKEAEYIYKAVKHSGALSNQTSLIVDIGGGSVEFIICDNQRIHWKQSFEIGAARLMDQFHQTDPISPASITALNLYLDDKLQQLFTAAAGHRIAMMIGTAGAFETYAALVEQKKGNAFHLEKIRCYQFDRQGLLSILEEIIRSTHQQRGANKVLIPVRVDMIVSASLITLFIIKRLGIQKVSMSTSSLKEGVLAEMMDQES